MDKYSVSGNGSLPTSGAYEGNLYTGGVIPISVSEFHWIVEKIGNLIPPIGIKVRLMRTNGVGISWGATVVPTPYDTNAPATQTTLGYQGTGTPPATVSVLLQIPYYTKSAIHWKAKKGKEIRCPAAQSGNVGLIIDSSPSNSFLYDYTFVFEE